MYRNDPDLCFNSDMLAAPVVFTFDLQQNLPVPTLTHGAMFYLSQLWVYNFGIHNCTDGAAIMYVWNECIAGKGSNEIIVLARIFRPDLRKLFRLIWAE